MTTGFDKYSNFDKRANFTEVKFGEQKPVLEVELNELQNIQNEARADIIRDTIPSGFTKLGELDYTFSANNPNTLRLKSDSIAYVDGYRILIPKGMTIDLGLPPEDRPREDLVFLEVWREEVTHEDTLHTQGGENLGTITNPIRDSRYPMETSRRIALKWRIRVGEVDFTTYPEGLKEPSSGHSQKAFVMPQGALEEPLPKEVNWSKNFISHETRAKNSALNKNVGDYGVFVAGHNVTNFFNTLDGFVYGVPMFRIKRRPSCGKAKPFEYQKIHPNSFAYEPDLEVLTAGKYEETHPAIKYSGSWISDSNSNHSSGSVKYALQAGDYFEFTFDGTGFDWVQPVNLKRGIAKVTIDEKSTTVDTHSTKEEYQKVVYSRKDLKPGRHTVRIEVTDSKHDEATEPNQTIDFITIYDDYKLKDRVERITDTSIKGLTIFNLYDTPEDTKDYSSVLAGAIPRNFTVHPDETIQIADNTSGMNVKLGIKKGKMIKQNTKYSFITYVSEYTCTKDSDFLHIYYGDACLNGAFIGNTQEIKKAGVYLDVLTSKAELDPSSDDIPLLNVVYQLTTGGVKFKVMIVEGDLTGKPLPDFCSYGQFNSVGSGDNSIVLKTTGSNLLNFKAFSPRANASASYLLPKGIKVKGTSLSNNPYVYLRINIGKLKPRTKYILGFKRNVIAGVSTVVVRTDSKFLTQSTDDSAITFTTTENDQLVYTVDLFAVNGTVGYGEVDYTKIFLFEVPSGVTASELSYIPYKDYKKTFQLDAPLRGIGNLYDEITTDKDTPILIRRLGQVTLNGSDNEEWVLDSTSGETTKRFYMKNNIKNVYNDGFMTSDRFRPRSGNHGDFEYILAHFTENASREPLNHFYVNIKTDKLTTPDVAGLRKWLKANPITLLYKLAMEQVTPLVEARENNINFSLNRQLQNTKYLRVLKDGTKDYIRMGKVHRKTGVLVLNGSESYTIAKDTASETNPTICFSLVNASIPRNGVSLSTVVPFYYEGIASSADVIQEGVATDGSNIFIRVLKSRLVNGEGVTGFKNMLAFTPITIVYPLKSETTEDLVEGVNDRFYPYHDINSYVGELYLEEGKNYTSAISPVPPLISKVATPFRQFTSTLPNCDITGCNFKKHTEGLPMCKVGAGKNLLDFKDIKPVVDSGEVELKANGFTVANFSGTAIAHSRAIIYDVILKPNTSYTLSCEYSVSEGEALISIIRQIDDVVVIESSNKSITFTTPNIQTKYKIQFYCTGSSAFTGGRVDYTNIQLEEGKSKTTYENFIPKEVAYEYINHRDVKDLRHLVSLSGFNYDSLLSSSLDRLLRGEIDQ